MQVVYRKKFCAIMKSYHLPMITSRYKLPTVLVSGGQLVNVKVMPAMLDGMMTRKMVQVLRTYLGNYKGMHVQINCVSADTLKAAQVHPEEYKDLMVRVAGYSALFTPLDKALQDDIIARTEHSA